MRSKAAVSRPHCNMPKYYVAPVTSGERIPLQKLYFLYRLVSDIQAQALFSYESMTEVYRTAVVDSGYWVMAQVRDEERGD